MRPASHMPLAERMTLGSGFSLMALESSRQKQGISVAELARRIGVGKKRLWYVLNGQRAMRADEFVKLCAFFNLGLGCFLDRKAIENLRSPEPFHDE